MELLSKIRNYLGLGHTCRFDLTEVMDTNITPKCVKCKKELPLRIKNF